MLICYIRSSSLANYSFCQQQYFINYVLGIPRDTNVKAAKGTVVHKVLECLALMKKYKQENPQAEILVINDEAVGEFSCRAEDFTTNKEMITSLTDRAFGYYAERNKFSKADYNDISLWVWSVLGYKQGLFDPRKREILQAEQKFDITIEEDWAKYEYVIGGETKSGNLAIKGTVDLLTKTDERVIEIIDWKTGQRLDWATGEEKTYEKLCTDQQLMLYYWAMKKMYPDYDIILTIYFIRDGGPFSICFDEKHLKIVEDNLRNKFNEIRDNKYPMLISPDQSNFKCTRICDYYKKNWPGTNTNICRFINEEIQGIGIEAVQDKYTHELHNIDKYQAPGE